MNNCDVLLVALFQDLVIYFKVELFYTKPLPLDLVIQKYEVGSSKMTGIISQATKFAMQYLFCLGSALEFLSTCKLANLTVKAELGCCLLHRSGRLTIDGCVLQCETNPLDFLSCPIVSTARSCITSTPMKSNGDSVTVLHTRIEGGAKAVLTSGDLVLQRVRVIYARTYLYFWFDVDHQ